MQVPLSAVVRYERDLSPLAVYHQGQFPTVTISFATEEGVTLQTATQNILQAVAELHMPEGIRAGFEGNARDFGTTSARQPLLILGALIAVYIVLGVLYESLLHPLTIISTLPSAGLGALLALQLTNTPLTVIAFIGIILLIGIVKKNGIMIVDFALEGERKHGLDPATAIFEASIVRFRPILMTTLAALLAAVPLVIATGPGTELRRPLGITIIGGLIVSQILTLYTTPVIYLLMDRLKRRREGLADRRARRLPNRFAEPDGTFSFHWRFRCHERSAEAAARHRKRRKTSRSAAGNRRGRRSPRGRGRAGIARAGAATLSAGPVLAERQGILGPQRQQARLAAELRPVGADRPQRRRSVRHQRLEPEDLRCAGEEGRCRPSSA